MAIAARACGADIKRDDLPKGRKPEAGDHRYHAPSLYVPQIQSRNDAGILVQNRAWKLYSGFDEW